MEDGIGESGCVREEYKFSISLFVFIRIQIREQVTSSLVFIFAGLNFFFSLIMSISRGSTQILYQLLNCNAKIIKFSINVGTWY